jgi:hypothetical protein
MNAMKLIKAIEAANLEARSYSGRGMYDKLCVGIALSRNMSSFKVGVLIAQAIMDGNQDECFDDLSDLAELNPSEDSLGLGSIVYFSSVKWPADYAFDEDDDGSNDEDFEEKE